MNDLINFYKGKLDLPNANFTSIDHEDAMVATVFKVEQIDKKDLILKVCSRDSDFLRESFFLNYFAKLLPVPKIIKLLKAEKPQESAVLMEKLNGSLLTLQNVDRKLALNVGSFLAKIHCQQVKGYGDLTDPKNLSADPRIPFRMKFEEGIEECQDHLPKPLIEKCIQLFDRDIDLLLSTDGPCIVHRDFRPGNIIAENGDIKGIIDWSSARGSFAEDDFCPLEFGEWPSACKNDFLEGYSSIRPVPDYNNVMPLLRLNRAVSIVGFIVKKDLWKTKNANLYQINRDYLDSLLDASRTKDKDKHDFQDLHDQDI
jgi:Ser/Thr protein kinase RdoA (MazF antagonist)